MTELGALLEQLRQGDRPSLGPQRVEALLGWLNGSAERDDRQAELPRPGHDPVLLQMVLYRLDDELFRDGELNIARAGVDPEQPMTRRRMRFRRLASAFHPDRFPDLSDWLTARSQAIHRAYARFKENPDEPAPRPGASGSPQPPTPTAKPTGYGYPRQRKAGRWAQALRARFGGDRYLAPKLVGGLAVIALLPVLNLVLVPEPNRAPDVPAITVNEPTSSTTKETRAAGKPPGRNPSETVAASDFESAGSENAESAAPVDLPPPGAGDNPLAPDVSPLLEAARRAMDPDGEQTSDPTLPSVDEQLESMGLATDTERLYRRMLAMESSDRMADRAPVESEANASAPADPSVPEPPPTADSENEPASVGAGPAGEEAGPDEESGPEEDSLAGQAPTADSGDEPASVGAGPAGEEAGPNEKSGPDGDSLAGQAPTADSADEPAAEDREPAQPMRRLQPGGVVPSVRSVLERNSKSDPEESAAEPAATERAGDSPVNRGSTEPAVGAGPAGEETGSNGDSLAGQAPTADSGDEPASVGAGPAGEEASPDEESGPDGDSLAGQAPTADSGNEPASVGAGPAGEEASPDEESGPNGDSLAGQAPTVGDSGDLVLGPLASHPVGKLVSKLHRKLEVGHVAGIASLFARDGRIGDVSGHAAIADHFRDWLGDDDFRRVDLRVARMRRQGEAWHVDTDLSIRPAAADAYGFIHKGRTQLVLIEREGRLVIEEMNP